MLKKIFKKHIADHNLKIKDIASEIGVSDRVLRNYLTGRSSGTYELTNKLFMLFEFRTYKEIII